MDLRTGADLLRDETLTIFLSFDTLRLCNLMGIIPEISTEGGQFYEETVGSYDGFCT